MSYLTLVPKSDYVKMKEYRTEAYRYINKALEQDKDKQSKVFQGGKWRLYNVLSYE